MGGSGGTTHEDPPTAAVDDSPIDLGREPSLRLGDLVIEPGLRRISNDDGREEIVEPRVMQVLVALARSPGAILTRDDLLASCWRGVVVGEDAITRIMGRVRRLAEGIGEGQFRLETITKVGYRLVPIERQTEGAPADAVAASRSLSVCVLPFANMSGDPEQEYFSDGISEDIMTDLMKVSALSVVARNTAFTFKGRAVDVPQVARQLGVSHVLEGSVRKAGGRVRITAQLVDGQAGSHIWAERYDRDLTDIFSLQDEISEAIVEALKLTLLPDEKQAIARRGTDNVQAYNLYLMARSYWLTGNNSEARQHEAMERLCRRAVDIDPRYAQAWVLLAAAQNSLHAFFGRVDDGRTALDRALGLDRDLAEARSLNAQMLSDSGRHDEAAAEIGAALRLDPQSWEVNCQAGSMSYFQGRLADAARYFEKAAALMGTSLKPSAMLVSCYRAMGDRDNTRRAARTALTRAEEAIARNRSNGLAMCTGVTALAALGETERAREWMNRALLVDPDNLLIRYNFACDLATWLNDPDGSLDMLGPVLGADSGWALEGASADPDLAGLREHPRFRVMIAATKARLAAGGVAPPVAP